jgi:hypothetical protein
MVTGLAVDNFVSSTPLALLVLQEDCSDCVHSFLSVVSISNYTSYTAWLSSPALFKGFTAMPFTARQYGEQASQLGFCF